MTSFFENIDPMDESLSLDWDSSISTSDSLVVHLTPLTSPGTTSCAIALHQWAWKCYGTQPQVLRQWKGGAGAVMHAECIKCTRYE